jgi:hypothetical protein
MIVQNSCEYCHNDFRINGKSSEILKLKQTLEELFMHSDPNEIIKLADNSVFNDYPIMKIRKVKAQIINCLFSSIYVNSHEFCEIIDVVNTISNETADYNHKII